jgi:hypothetical protein
LLLRASGEVAGSAVDVSAIADPAHAAMSGVAHAEALLAFADAAVDEDAEGLPAARERLRRELGDAALVDAAAVIANFERMTRIADATGIPLDPPVRLLTGDVREALGVHRFGGAEAGRRSAWPARWAARLAWPLFRRLVRARRRVPDP